MAVRKVETKGKTETEMIDISAKNVVPRMAVAQGTIQLTKESMTVLRKGMGAKGQVFPVAEVAGINAAKRTHELIPLCHQIPLDYVRIKLIAGRAGVTARCEAAAHWKTGVEMEALTGVSVALLTIWDMVKSSEKDTSGQYPETSIEHIRVMKKYKGESKRP
jgi:cyclic pyranopterin phosphate synthase